MASGDIIVARIGATTGKASIVKECPQAVFASYLIRLRAKKNKLDASYLASFCETKIYWQQIDQNKGGKLKGGVNIPILQAIQLPLPPLPEQQRIAAVLGALDAKLGALGTEVARLEELFRALLEELLSGRLRVGGF